MPIEIQGRESVKIHDLLKGNSCLKEDGKHTGKIEKIESRDIKDYTYLDVFVQLADVKTTKDEPVTIKYGCPLDLTANTKLGKLLVNFGITKEQISSGETINVEDILKVGTEVVLMTQEETTDRGTFARIWCNNHLKIDGSLKPT